MATSTRAKTIDIEVLPPETKASAADAVAAGWNLDQWIAMLAWVMDDYFRVPGTKRRFGFDPLIGLIPGIGGGATGALSAFTIFRGAQLGVPKIVLARMALNILIDSGVTIIPVVGDAFSFWFKSFARNHALLVKHGDPDRPRQPTTGDRIFVWSLVIFAVAIPLAAVFVTAAVVYQMLTHLFG